MTPYIFPGMSLVDRRMYAMACSRNVIPVLLTDDDISNVPEMYETFIDASLKYVCELFEVNRETIISKSRDHTTIMARKLLIIILRRHLSWSKIAKVLEKDHSTCIHATRYFYMNPKIFMQTNRKDITKKFLEAQNDGWIVI